MDESDETENEIAELLKPFWSAPRAAEALGLETVDDLAALASAGSLVACTTLDGTLVVPLRQFVRVDGQLSVRPGLADVFFTLRAHDPWTVAVLVLGTYDPDLGAAPWEVADGLHDEELRNYAGRLRHEWSGGRDDVGDSPRVLNVLFGDVSYDDVDRETQALVRAAWEERATAARLGLNLAAELTAQGRSWSELDDDGDVVLRNDPPEANS